MARQSRRNDILQAYAAMLQTNPGTRITTAALAARVGVSEAALYRHFPSKAKIIDGLLEFAEETVFGRIGKIVAGEPNPAERCGSVLALLLADAPLLAAEAIEAVAYETVRVAYGDGGIALRLDRGDATPARTLRFETPAEFVKNLPELGLEPCFLNVLGTAEALERHAAEQLAAWRSGDGRDAIADPPYRAPRVVAQA